MPLVEVDRSVAELSSTGDKIRVFDESGLLVVENDKGFLGNVAPHFVATVRQARLTRGVILALERDPLVIRVLLRR